MYVLSRICTFLLGGTITLIGIFAFIQVYNPHGLLFGIFQVNTVHTAAHLATGAIGILIALVRRGRYAAWYLLGMGLLYGVLTIFGFIFEGNLFGLAYFNFQDNLLHASVALVSLLMSLFIAIERPEMFVEQNSSR
jgi:hypothetical protein